MAVRLGPKNSDLQRSLANLYAELGDLQGEAEFQQAMQMNPGNVPALAEWGGLLAARGRMAEAESKWSAALAINPRSAYVYTAEADALPLDPDDDRAAIAKLRTALTINPRDAEVHRKLANQNGRAS